MAANLPPIQLLLEAEQIGKKTIEEAKKQRIHLLNKAKKEATDEVNRYRLEREKQFRALLEVSRDEIRETEQAIQGIVKNELKAIDKSVAENKFQVVNRLMELVCDVRPQMHHNLVLQRKLEGLEGD